MVIFKIAETTEELIQILKLQQKNLPTQLSNEEKKKEGFVTVSHSLEILQKMNTMCPHIIATDNNVVVGYALCMHPCFANEIEVLKPMFVEIEKVFPKENKFIVMGQICIDKNYRGQGFFKKLYQNMKEEVQPEFEYIITEVDAANTRSLNAHYAVGFTDLATYISNEQEWKLIVLE